MALEGVVMEVLDIILLLLVGAGACFVQRVSGFGLAIFAMLFLPYFLPTPVAAASVSNLISCATSSYNSIYYRKNISLKVVMPLIIAVLVTVPFAVYLSNRISAKSFHVVLGIVQILLSIYFIFFGKKMKFKPTITKGILCGIGSGILNGLFSTGGPPAVIYVDNVSADKNEYFACIQFFFAVSNIYALIFRILNGLITIQLLGYALVAAVGCFFGNYIGKKVFNRLDGKTIKTIIYIAMFISGIIMILK